MYKPQRLWNLKWLSVHSSNTASVGKKFEQMCSRIMLLPSSHYALLFSHIWKVESAFMQYLQLGRKLCGLIESILHDYTYGVLKIHVQRNFDI